jgi:PAS domain S-box-containing protein
MPSKKPITDSDKKKMNYHKKLESQITELLPDFLKEMPGMELFLQAINDTYEQIDQNKHQANKIHWTNRPAIEKEILRRNYRDKIFNSLLNNLKSGLLLVDETGHIIDCNDALLQVFNVKQNKESVTGMPVAWFFQDVKAKVKDPEGFISGVNKIMLNKKQFLGELIETEDGRFFERDYNPIFSQTQYLGHLWNYVEVTKKKISQDQIAQNEFTQRQVLNAALDGVILINHQGLVELWNPQAEKILGWSFEETIHSFLDADFKPVKAPKDEQIGIAGYAQQPKNSLQEQALVLDLKNKWGEDITVELSVVPMTYFSRKYYCAFLRDITNRKRMEAEIIRQKQFTEDVLNHLPADIAVFDADHSYLYVNPNGIKNEEIRNWLIGKNDFDYCKLKGIDTKLAENRWKLFNEAVVSRKASQWIDEIRDPETKKWKYVLRNYFPYFENDDIKYVFGYGIDITEFREVQIKLSEAMKELENTNEELEHFAYIISHDLQEPLRMVKSFLQLLEKKAGPKLDETDLKYMQFANSGADRMKKHIQDLLEYSRIGKKKEEVQQVDCAEIVNELNILFQLKIEETKSKLVIHPLPTIAALKAGLFHLFQNLIGNALKYRKPDQQENIVEVGYTDEGDKWQFYVKDSGTGIDQKFFERIFILFQRLDSNKDEHSGTGVGLAICKKIVELHRGSIWVTSEIGIGSCFYFTIPKNFQLNEE